MQMNLLRQAIPRCFWLTLCLSWQTGIWAQGLQFIDNQGQWSHGAAYQMALPSGFLLADTDYLHYAFYSGQDISAFHPGGKVDPRLSAKLRRPQNGKIRAHGVRIRFEGAQPDCQIIPSAPQPEKYHYYLGDKEAHPTAYAALRYQALYPGTDLLLKQAQGSLKYEFHLNVGADPSNIRMLYQGATKLQIQADGHLRIHTSVNTFEEQAPYCYQMIAGQEVPVPSAFVLNGNRLGFEFPEGYDAAYPLVIDPVLIFSTFSGSISDNWGYTATYDEQGRLYSGGIVFGNDFPATVGAFQVQFDSLLDVAVQRYSADGSQLEYASFLGGRNTEAPHSMIVNQQGELVVFGTTGSADFPTTSGAYDFVFEGGPPLFNAISGINFANGSDMFITVFSADASRLVGSTYVGGSNTDGINEQTRLALSRNYGDEFRGEVEVDAAGNIYIASVTNSDDFPVIGGYQNSLNGTQDAVAFKMSRDCRNFLGGSYFGGSQLDAAYSIELLPDQTVAVGGGTNSEDLSLNGHQSSYQGGSADGFIAVFDQFFTTVISGSFVGTPEYDQVYFISQDRDGKLVALGQTEGNYPMTAGKYARPNSGIFLQEYGEQYVNAVGYSTLIGKGNNSPDFSPTAFLVSDCGQIYVSGWAGVPVSTQNTNYYPTTTLNLPVTDNAFQSTTEGNDFYVMVLSEGAEDLVYASYFGGTIGSGEHVDGGTSRFDRQGNVYQSVCSCSDNSFPTTENAYDTVNDSDDGNGNIRCNNAAFKISLDVLKADFEFEGPNITPEKTACAPLQLTLDNRSIGGRTFRWELIGEGVISTQRDQVNITLDQPGEQIIKLTALDPASCLQEDVHYDTITIIPAEFEVSAPITICVGDSVQLAASGATSYRWAPSATLSDSLAPNPRAFPTETTTYTVVLENEFGCIEEREVTVTVNEPFETSFSVEYLTDCDTIQRVRLQNLTEQGESFLWDFGDGRTSTDRDPGVVRYEAPGSYDITLSVLGEGCQSQRTLRVTVALVPSSFFYEDVRISPDTLVCEGESTVLSAAGGSRYEWLPTTGLSNPNIANPAASPSETTEYTVRVFNDEGCFVDSTVTVTVVPELNAEFSIFYEESCGESPRLTMENLTENAESFIWQMGNGQTLTESPTDFQYVEPGRYTVTMVANLGSCSETVTKEILIEQIKPPNVITPNGDGKNDTFVVGSARSGWQLEVFNRWGEPVFQTSDYQNDWSPTELSNTSYFYLLTSPSGLRCRGWIQILSD